jgi:hypothetical protein
MLERVNLSQIIQYTSDREAIEQHRASKYEDRNLAAHCVVSNQMHGVNPEEVISASSIRAAIGIFPGLVEGSESRPYYTINDYSLFSKTFKVVIFIAEKNLIGALKTNGMDKIAEF